MSSTWLPPEKRLPEIEPRSRKPWTSRYPRCPYSGHECSLRACKGVCELDVIRGRHEEEAAKAARRTA